eukprot:204260-Pelagomonas_calceolata.AAC.8
MLRGLDVGIHAAVILAFMLCGCDVSIHVLLLGRRHPRSCDVGVYVIFGCWHPCQVAAQESPLLISFQGLPISWKFGTALCMTLRFHAAAAAAAAAAAVMLHTGFDVNKVGDGTH